MTIDLAAYDDGNADLRAHMGWQRATHLSWLRVGPAAGAEPTVRPVPHQQLEVLTSNSSRLRKASLLTAVCKDGCSLANVVQAAGLLCIITRDVLAENHWPLQGEPEEHGPTRLRFNRLDVHPDTPGTTAFWTACRHRRAVITAQWIAAGLADAPGKRVVVPAQAPTVEINGASKPAEHITRLESAARAYGSALVIEPVGAPDGMWLAWTGSFVATIA